jgi:hypothetical protein
MGSENLKVRKRARRICPSLGCVLVVGGILWCGILPARAQSALTKSGTSILAPSLTPVSGFQTVSPFGEDPMPGSVVSASGQLAVPDAPVAIPEPPTKLLLTLTGILLLGFLLENGEIEF